MAADVPQDDASARSFFELFFKPVVVGKPPALFTGYFEPELDGSPVRTGRFQYPIYRRPPELRDGSAVSYPRQRSRAAQSAGRGLELAWLDDPVDVYFLQVQGSGRIRMTDGTVVRVGYAGANGHAYRSDRARNGPARHAQHGPGLGTRNRVLGPDQSRRWTASC